MAGMAGFEPTNARVKVWCLTAWRHPNKDARLRTLRYYSTVFCILQQLFVVYSKNMALHLRFLLFIAKSDKL